MIIMINSDWRITSDQLQWIVQKRRAVRGDDRWDSVAYFGTLDGAVLSLAQRRIRVMEGTYGAEALAPLCHALDRLQDEIRRALKDGYPERFPPAGR